uniref:Uncharacterized protein n=1 Tax=Theileria annulata TaxID=5874 RepID=A0A3B0MWJ4_THEAN
MKLLNERKEYLRIFDKRIYEILLNYSFSYFFNNIWNFLSNSYHNLEDIIQNRIIKLRMELNLNLSLLIFNNRRDMNDINIIPIVEKLHQMEKSNEIEKKMRNLSEAVEMNKSESNEETVSYIILAIVVGGLKHTITHSALLYIYINTILGNNHFTNNITNNITNNCIGNNCDGLENIKENLNIFNSAISFLLE